MIRNARLDDTAAIAAIYNHYVLNTTVTFEEQPVGVEEMSHRIAETQHANLAWLVCEDGGKPVGYCYASKWKSRCSYRYSLETTVYLDQGVTGRGIGTQLYTALIEALRPTKMHALIGGIALPNPR